MTPEPTSKTPRQRERILRLLLAAGPAGCSNLLLNEVGFRFAARIYELRKEWDIATVRESETVYRFVLQGKKGEKHGDQIQTRMRSSRPERTCIAERYGAIFDSRFGGQAAQLDLWPIA